MLVQYGFVPLQPLQYERYDLTWREAFRAAGAKQYLVAFVVHHDKYMSSQAYCPRQLLFPCFLFARSLLRRCTQEVWHRIKLQRGMCQLPQQMRPRGILHSCMTQGT